jgi:transposase
MQLIQGMDRTPVLAISLELAGKAWKVAATDGSRVNPAVIKVDESALGKRLEQLIAALAGIKQKWRLGAQVRTVVIYEAGQDGFWIARALQARGVQVLVVDAASVAVSRHARRAKTDRLDALRLLQALRGWLRGEAGELRVLHIPSEEAEARRQLPRERGLLQKEIGQHRDRMRKLLRTVGCIDELEGDFGQRLVAGEVRCADGKPVPAALRERLQHECERLQLAWRQLRGLEKTLLQQLPEPVQRCIAQLAALKGVGWVGAMRLVLELFWREFSNRRQVGACVGLVPQPYDSGDSRVDQGISKQGNGRVRALLIEMAWMWLRYQPGSDLAQWFARRTAGSGKRGKRVAIVAVARRLAIALWRYLKDGVLPQGAQMKTA